MTEARSSPDLGLTNNSLDTADTTSHEERWTVPTTDDPTQLFQFSKNVGGGSTFGRGGASSGLNRGSETNQRFDGGSGTAIKDSASVGRDGVGEDNGRDDVEGANELANIEETPNTRRNLDGPRMRDDRSVHGVEELTRGSLSRGSASQQATAPSAEKTFLSQLRITPPYRIGFGIGSRMNLSSIIASSSSNARSSFGPSTSSTPDHPSTQFSTSSPLSRTLAPMGSARQSLRQGSDGIPSGLKSFLSGVSSPSASLAGTTSTPPLRPSHSKQLVSKRRPEGHPLQEDSPSLAPSNPRQQVDVNQNVKKRAATTPTRDRTPSSRAASIASFEGGGERLKDDDMSDTKRQKLDVSDVLSSIVDMKTLLDAKNTEIKHLHDSLCKKEEEALKAVADKERMKKLSLVKIRSVLSDFDIAKNEVESASAGMRSAFQNISSELGGVVAAADVKAELKQLKEDLQARYGNSDNAMISQERAETTKIELLRELQREIDKRQDVIELLRQDLATKMGEISEARDRVSYLEAQWNTRSTGLESYAAESSLFNEGITKSIAKFGALFDEGGERHLSLAVELEESRSKAASLEVDLFHTKQSTEDQRENLRIASEQVLSLRVACKYSTSKIQESRQEAARLASRLELTDASKTQLRTEFDESLSRLRENQAESITIIKNDFEIAQAACRMDAEKTSLSAKSAFEKTVEACKAAASKQVAELDSRLKQAEEKIVEITALKIQLRSSEIEVASVKGELERSRSEVEIVAREKDEKFAVRVAESKKAIASYSRKLEDLTQRNEVLVADVLNLKDQLSSSSDLLRKSQGNSNETKQAQAEMLQLRQSNKQLQDTIMDLLGQVDAAKSSIEQFSGDKEKITAAMHSLTEAQTRLVAQTVVIEDLQAKVNESSSAQSKLAAQLLELSNTQASAVQKASAETYKNCEEGFKRELAQKGNELKRLNNRLDEATKKWQKALTELAKAKNRPLIDTQVVSSSPVDDIGPDEVQASRSSRRVTFKNIAAAGPDTTQDENSITLSSLNDDPSSEPDDIVDFTMPVPKATSGKAVSGKVASDVVNEVAPRRNRSLLVSTNTNRMATEEDIEEADNDVEMHSIRGKLRNPVKKTYATKKRV